MSHKCSLVDKGSAGAGSVARLQIWNRNSTHWLVLLLEREGKDLTGVTELRCIPLSFAVVDTPNCVAFPLRQ